MLDSPRIVAQRGCGLSRTGWANQRECMKEIVRALAITQHMMKKWRTSR